MKIGLTAAWLFGITLSAWACAASSATTDLASAYFGPVPEETAWLAQLQATALDRLKEPVLRDDGGDSVPQIRFTELYAGTMGAVLRVSLADTLGVLTHRIDPRGPFASGPDKKCTFSGADWSYARGLLDDVWIWELSDHVSMQIDGWYLVVETYDGGTYRRSTFSSAKEPPLVRSVFDWFVQQVNASAKGGSRCRATT